MELSSLRGTYRVGGGQAFRSNLFIIKGTIKTPADCYALSHKSSPLARNDVTFLFFGHNGLFSVQ